MSAPRILIVYGSTYGQTAKIAGRLRDRLAERGCGVVLTRGDPSPETIPVTGYDAVVVGASLIAGGYQKYIRRFVKAHVEGLNGAHSAFFAVCGSEGGADEAAKAEARRIQREFLEKAGWRPALTASFAGAIAYTKYNVFLRMVMKRISRKAGGSTDTSRDHEYTDWSRVEAFADEVCALAREAMGPGRRSSATETPVQADSSSSQFGRSASSQEPGAPGISPAESASPPGRPGRR